MKLPDDLINQVRQARVVLFLGAGATRKALTPKGKEPPLGNDLRDRIVEHFLGGEYAKESLAWVTDLSIAARDLFTVQDFIAEQFRDIKPAAFHLLIPTFRWRGIATTNYDRLIENAYDLSPIAIQKLVPFISNADRVDDKLRDQTSLPLLKLHGCITRTHDEQLPLILTPDQFETCRKNRTRLFQMLEEWGSENAIIFIGHALQDSSLLGILRYLSEKVPSRPKYYLVRPSIGDIEREYWNRKRITVIDATFEEFLHTMDGAISKEMRPILSMQHETEHAIEMRFVTKHKPSQALQDFLSNEAEYIFDGMPAAEGNPPKFYSGFDLGWYPIQNILDVRRHLTDKLLNDIILRPEADRPSRVELYLVKAEAGAGKSVFLRRLAWEGATKAGALCLRSCETAYFTHEALLELSKCTNERIFIFIDHAADHIRRISEVLDYAKKLQIRLTVVTSERINEWNVRCDVLEQYLSEQYEIRYLNLSEIEELIHLLERHDSLGPNLTKKTHEKRILEFKEIAGRQLLVALHEATRGRPYEEILLDEYSSIVPREAQRLYLSVCILNRLRVAVRAGLISRVHGIRFEEFKQRLFKPLEHVISVIKMPWGDYAYEARHPEIAQIVFDQVLKDSAERFNEYCKIIRYLNPIYSIDREAMRGMLRAKAVDALFSNYEDGKAIYDLAREAFGDDAFILQQQANYERIRPSGNLRLAKELIEKALEKEPSDSTIMHTLAEVVLAQSEKATHKLEKERFRKEAIAILGKMRYSPQSGSYAAVTRLKIAISQVKDILQDESSTDREIDDGIREYEQAIDIAKQRYPGDSHILVAESDFAKLLEDNERSIDALKKARQINTRDPYIVSRLSAIMMARGEEDTAKKYIEEALASNSGDKRLHFQYAEILRKSMKSSADELAYYYRRAFSKWDENYESQFWYARYAYESNNTGMHQEAKEIFKHLREIAMSHEEQIKIRDVIGGKQDPNKLTGAIAKKESSYGFIAIDGRGDSIFIHETDIAADLWSQLSMGTRVRFSIGFNIRGPKAIKIGLEARES